MTVLIFGVRLVGGVSFSGLLFCILFSILFLLGKISCSLRSSAAMGLVVDWVCPGGPLSAQRRPEKPNPSRREPVPKGAMIFLLSIPVSAFKSGGGPFFFSSLWAPHPDQADTKDLSSSSKFSASCVLTLQSLPGGRRKG